MGVKSVSELRAAAAIPTPQVPVSVDV
jgi:hypothetical protein